MTYFRTSPLLPGGQFDQFALNNMMGRMLGHSMRVSGVDSDGDGVRQAMSDPYGRYKTREEADAAIALKAAEYKAKREAAMNTPEAKKSTQDWLASMTPANRRIYSLMMTQY